MIKSAKSVGVIAVLLETISLTVSLVECPIPVRIGNGNIVMRLTKS